MADQKKGLRILGWIVGILVLISGVFGFGSGVLYAIIVIIAGLLIIPPAHDLIAKKMGAKMALWPKWIVIVVLLIVAGYVQQ
ncbi:hypothetical protein A3B32_01105 [Candidatus Uhrbacteria bacterium RIFCSPLOWO2_01_FULL_53_9]|uniref:Uncharacterized protein n=3 Tax=Candidatus Uhriibacteriota TaxID=1752732 RepID=A0A1F7UYE1_9BACT|nr:MAG: hypothetical protein A3C17_02295 [Candidatus Uhrbacteria bacterium RIFCSPHIGHO2_02_FULL_53_13]OGL83291.1 MAG: hypothetical protein A3B32_01105 [Candidatus Uhrbacteria bacterium RIFCSPLOWO2_01_FULL_53_9]OGL88988.1 MAG: hypothetical protein A3I45_01530 [Candidatus Uhrbacteria bacterium RIFCSPLOWO2_02_FULL_53_10]